MKRPRLQCLVSAAWAPHDARLAPSHSFATHTQGTTPPPHNPASRAVTAPAQLLHTLELHAALISSAEALLALPLLLTQPLPEPAPGTQHLERVQKPEPQTHPPAITTVNGDVHDVAAAAPEGSVGPRSTGRSNGAGIGSPQRGKGGEAVGAAEWVPGSGAAWHHVGFLRGPIYATQAAIDAAEQLVAERWAAQRAAAAAAAAAARNGTSGQGFKTHTEAAQEEQAYNHKDTGDLRTNSKGAAGLPSAADLGLWDLPDRQVGLLAGSCWRRRPSLAAVRYVLDRVRPVRYGQVVPLDDYELTATPYPCGSGFGHAAWQVMDGAE